MNVCSRRECADTVGREVPIFPEEIGGTVLMSTGLCSDCSRTSFGSIDRIVGVDLLPLTLALGASWRAPICGTHESRDDFGTHIVNLVDIDTLSSHFGSRQSDVRSVRIGGFAQFALVARIGLSLLQHANATGLPSAADAEIVAQLIDIMNDRERTGVVNHDYLTSFDVLDDCTKGFGAIAHSAGLFPAEAGAAVLLVRLFGHFQFSALLTASSSISGGAGVVVDPLTGRSHVFDQLPHTSRIERAKGPSFDVDAVRGAFSRALSKIEFYRL